MRNRDLVAGFALIILALVLLPLTAGRAGAAESYPKRPITVIVPYMPGGLVDMAARPFAEAMSKELGVPVVVTPTPGAGGVVGTTKALSAKPNGYTLLLASDITFVYHPLLRKVQYTPEDNRPIYGVLQAITILAASKKNAKFQSFEDFIAYAKNNPGQVTVGMTGMKSIHFGLTKRLETIYGIKVQAVPFDGGVQVSNAIVSGHVDTGFTEVITNADLLPLVVTSGKNDYLKGARDFEDLGKPELRMAIGYHLSAHKDVPEKYCAILEAAAAKASHDPTYLKVLESVSALPYRAGKDAILKETARERDLLQQLINEGQIAPD